MKINTMTSWSAETEGGLLTVSGGSNSPDLRIEIDVPGTGFGQNEAPGQKAYMTLTIEDFFELSRAVARLTGET